MADRDIEQMLEDVSKNIKNKKDMAVFKEIVMFLAEADSFIIMTEAGVAFKGGLVERAFVFANQVRHPDMAPVARIAEGLTLSAMRKSNPEDEKQ